jgi:hypothetical protein
VLFRWDLPWDGGEDNVFILARSCRDWCTDQAFGEEATKCSNSKRMGREG